MVNFYAGPECVVAEIEGFHVIATKWVLDQPRHQQIIEYGSLKVRVLKVNELELEITFRVKFIGPHYVAWAEVQEYHPYTATCFNGVLQGFEVLCPNVPDGCAVIPRVVE